MISRHLVIAGIGIAGLFLIAGFTRPALERWPDVPAVEATWQNKIVEEVAKPRTRAFIADQKPHKADEDYLNYSTRSAPRNTDNINVDAQGLPKVKYGKRFYYNPVTLSQFALASYGRHQTEPMIAAVERVITMMDADGALRYPFPYRHYVETLPLNIGWTSGMAQGQFLSAVGRAYKVTGDKKYLDAGNKVMAFLQTKHPYGPMTTMADLDPSLSSYIFFLEYPSEPNVYTLNGYMFTLLGLYDWSQLANSSEAARLFERGIETLGRILPYYDLGKITSYDLSHVTHAGQPFQIQRKPHVVARYHAVHVNQLRALHSVTGSAPLDEFAKKWSAY